jgi:hypothetical protein
MMQGKLEIPKKAPLPGAAGPKMPHVFVGVGSNPTSDTSCHVLQMGSVTNNSTWVRIGYRIYSVR